MATEIVVKTRDEVIAGYKRSYKLRLPDADTRDGMQPDITARCCADALMPTYANAKNLGRGLLLSGRRGQELDDVGAIEGVPRLDAKGSSGFVEIAAGSSGAWIFEGDELTDPETQIVYLCTNSLKYSDGDDVPVEARDTGPTTNLDAGTVLRWSGNRPGLKSLATVVAQTDGSGLSGGRDQETDDDYEARIIEARRQRSNSGNDAEYQRQARATPGVGVEQVFTYPAILGPGTTGLVFTIRPATVGGSRIPNAAQVAAVEEWLRGKFPGDDGLIMSSLLDEELLVQSRIKWDTNVTPWLDTIPWPAYYAIGGTPGAVQVQSSSHYASAVLECDGADYTGVVQPTVGANLALFDVSHQTFSRKKILTIAGVGPWTLTFDTAEGATDTYQPVAGQLVMPWSESLQLLVSPARTYVDSMGPGQQVSSDPGDGVRRMRNPAPKATSWPLEVGNRLETSLLVSGVADTRVEYTDPTQATVGTQGVSSYLLRLTDLALYPWS